MPRREELRVPGMPEPMGLFTDAVRWGDLVFVSGIAPIDGDGKLVGADDMTEQTRQVMRNIQLVLDHVGATFDDLLRETTYITELERRKEMHPARREFYGAGRPASTLVEVRGLPVPGAMVEIDVVVGIPEGAGER